MRNYRISALLCALTLAFLACGGESSGPSTNQTLNRTKLLLSYYTAHDTRINSLVSGTEVVERCVERLKTSFSRESFYDEMRSYDSFKFNPPDDRFIYTLETMTVQNYMASVCYMFWAVRTAAMPWGLPTYGTEEMLWQPEALPTFYNIPPSAADFPDYQPSNTLETYPDLIDAYYFGAKLVDPDASKNKRRAVERVISWTKGQFAAEGYLSRESGVAHAGYFARALDIRSGRSPRLVASYLKTVFQAMLIPSVMIVRKRFDSAYLWLPELGLYIDPTTLTALPVLPAEHHLVQADVITTKSIFLLATKVFGRVDSPLLRVQLLAPGFVSMGELAVYHENWSELNLKEEQLLVSELPWYFTEATRSVYHTLPYSEVVSPYTPLWP